MGRKEQRYKAKHISKKLSNEQFEKLQSDINKEYINDEVESQTKFFRKIFAECLKEAFIKNNITVTKANMILDDVAVIMQRKVSDKRGKS